MGNNQDFMNDSEMLAMLEQLRRDIDADIERRKMAYLGKDGKDYYDKESLDIANKAYIENMYKFIGKDGQYYSTTKELEEANRKYQETMFPKMEDNNLYYNDEESSHKRK